MAGGASALGRLGGILGTGVITAGAAQACALAWVWSFGPHGWTQPHPVCEAQRVCVLVAGLEDDVSLGFGAAGQIVGLDIRDDTAQRLADDLTATTPDGHDIQVLRYPVEIGLPRAGDAHMQQTQAAMLDRARRIGRDAHANLVVVGRVVNDDYVTLGFVDPRANGGSTERIQYQLGNTDSRTALLQSLSTALFAVNNGAPLPQATRPVLPPTAPAPHAPEAQPEVISTNPVAPSATTETIAPAPIITPARRNLLPSAQIMDQVYPRRAREHGVRGQVTVSCAVSADGRLTACDIVRETPDGQGFGDAARTLAQNYTTAFPELRDGDPVDGGMLRITYTFIPRER